MFIELTWMWLGRQFKDAMTPENNTSSTMGSSRLESHKSLHIASCLTSQTWPQTPPKTTARTSRSNMVKNGKSDKTRTRRYSKGILRPTKTRISIQQVSSITNHNSNSRWHLMHNDTFLCTQNSHFHVILWCQLPVSISFKCCRTAVLFHWGGRILLCQKWHRHYFWSHPHHAFIFILAIIQLISIWP